AELIPEWWVADGHTPDPVVPVTFTDADEFGAEVVSWAEGFRLEAQRFQPVYIEVLCEAADLCPRLARVAGDYGVPVYPSGGMDSIKPKRQMGERAARRGVATVVLQVGDRDNRGDVIYLAAA